MRRTLLILFALFALILLIPNNGWGGVGPEYSVRHRADGAGDDRRPQISKDEEKLEASLAELKAKLPARVLYSAEFIYHHINYRHIDASTKMMLWTNIESHWALGEENVITRMVEALYCARSRVRDSRRLDSLKAQLTALRRATLTPEDKEFLRKLEERLAKPQNGIICDYDVTP